ncbi:MAG: polyphosphate kinase 2 family protein [Gemmatimonadota bacterium]|nr:polyphosphate kinase 2 family protein [Gemmatimonadota bacterium]
MLLEPVKQGDTLELSDEDASVPKSIGKGDEIKEKLEKQLEKIGELQKVFYADGRRSLLVILQGRDAAGKDGVVRSVIGACNPSGVRITSFKAPTPLELAHDYLWRIHQAVPEKGMMGIFNRSHYEDVLIVRVRSLVPEEVWSKRYDQINDFERMLSENGTVILKFFLHVSREEQTERLRERVEDETKNWKFNPGDLEERKLWDEYTIAYRDALAPCSTEWAPWFVVPSDSNKARNYLIAKRIVATLESLGLEYPKPKADLTQYLEAL